MGKIQECFDFIKSQRINKKMIPIKLFSSFFDMGTYAIFPYLTLQMTEIGLNYSDIGFIYLIIPAATFFSAPISGYIGDRIGYRIVIIINLIIVGLSAISFDWTPRFVEFYRTPTITFNAPSDVTEVLQFQWPIQDCSIKNITVNECKNDIILSEDNFWLNLDVFSNCSTDNISLTLYEVPKFIYFEVLHLERNGTFCSAKTSSNSWKDDEIYDLRLCNLDQYGTDYNIRECYDSEGSHQRTFWIYLLLRVLFQSSLLSIYSCIDGTILRHARDYNSDYAWVMVYNNIATLISPPIAGVLIKEAPEGSDEETDYSRSVYFFNAILAFVIVVAIFLKVNLRMEAEKSKTEKEKKKEHRKQLKKLFTPSILIFFASVASSGLSWGIKDSYLNIYLVQEMNASYLMIGYASTIATAAGIISLPIAQWFAKRFILMHIVFFSLLGQFGLMILFVSIKQSPPTFIYGLQALDKIFQNFFWIASMSYAYKLAPPTLIGTMAALLNSVIWVITKGISSFVGGQILELGISLSELFVYSAIFCAAWSMMFYSIYILYGRFIDKKLIEKNEAKRLEMEGENIKSGDTELKEKEDSIQDKFDTSQFSVTHF